MIKLSLNSPEVPKQQASAPFASTLAAAVEAAGAQPLASDRAPYPAKKKTKQPQAQLPSNGLLSRGVRWLQKGRSKKRMEMIETVSLGEKRFVALVKVDGREFLLGGAPSSVGMLADLGAHGLGDLLSHPISTESKLTEPPAPLQGLLEEPNPGAFAATVAAVPIQPRTASVIEPVLPPEKVVAAELTAMAAPAEPTRLNVVLEADEEESNWLLQDDLDAMFKSDIAVGPSLLRNETSKVVEIHPEPLAPKIADIVEQPAFTVVAAHKPVAPATNAAFVRANFTFQMWPAVPIAGTTLTPKSAAPARKATKAKTGIDLESCPELLAEPYLLALVEKSRGAAA